MDSASFDAIENCFHYLCVLPGELLPIHFVLNEVWILPKVTDWLTDWFTDDWLFDWLPYSLTDLRNYWTY